MPQRVSVRDVALLAEERSRSPLHVATVAILEPGDDGFDYRTLVDLINERISFVPRYRQRLVSAPTPLARPVWIDDEDFDLTYHVRRSALPRPGSMQQLEELVARLLARRLDRSRPLWEAYIVEGLAADRVALVIKSHQALVDGTHTVDLAQVMVDETARIRDVPADHWQPRAAPGTARLVMDSVVADVRSPREALGIAAHRVGQVALAALPVTPSEVRNPLSAALSRQRRYVTVATELEDYRRVRDQHGGTVNDVVLATIAGGLRGWLFTRGEQVVPTMKIRALVPMSVLDEQQPTSLGSAVVGHLLSLPVGESNPVVRLHQVSYALKAHKETGRAVAAGKLAALPGFVPTTFHAIGARIVHEHPSGAYQLAVTNVPGSQEQLFVAGARMVQTYPALPLTEGHVLSIGATSYAGGVYLGLVSDRDAMPDVGVLAACLTDALHELVESASTTRTRAPRGRRPPQNT